MFFLQRVNDLVFSSPWLSQLILEFVLQNSSSYLWRDSYSSKKLDSRL